MTQSPSTVVEFQKRRLATWRAVRVWFAVVVLSSFGLWLSKGSEKEISSVQFSVALACFVMAGASFIVIIQKVRRLYRCPACDSIPGTDGVAINPSTCPTCGAKLNE
jgi:hypothetical protein